MEKRISPQEAHQKAEKARERDDHPEALRFIEEAVVGYASEQNYEKMADALQSRVLIYKHLFLLTNDKSFAIIARKNAEASLEIAQEHGLNISSPQFRLGEVSMLFEDYGRATYHYDMALKNYFGTNAEKGDYTYHYGEAIFKLGSKEKGKQIMLDGLSLIQKNREEVDPLLANVWESGCYMKLAELLREKEPEEAKKYLDKARGIIDSDEKLVIRKRQLNGLSKSFE